MLEFAQFGALSVALVSFCLSLTALLIHYAKRHDNPITAPLQQQIDALQLGQTDIIDRVNSWTRRDSTRRARAAESNEEAPIDPNQAKNELRRRAMALRGQR
jgi:hypothetical protein